MKLKDYIQTAVAACVLFGIVFGAINYFAKASELELVAVRLDQKIAADKIYQIQQRLWQLEDRYRGKPCSEWDNVNDRNEYRRLKEVIKQMEKQIYKHQ